MANIIASLLLRLIPCFAVVALTLAPAGAHESEIIEPRIGYKDASVLKSELRQLGFPEAEVVKLGESAEISLKVNGEDVRIEMDRRLGGIRVLQASPAARTVLKDKIPARQLRPVLKSPEIVSPVIIPVTEPAVVAVRSQEDCLSFNTATSVAKRVKRRWKVVDGSQWMFDFGSNATDARTTARIIEHYGMNKSCFVGRPNPPMTYMLVDDAAPAGPFPKEDCISFDPARLAVIKAQGRWKIAGGSWLFDFDDRKDLAENGLAIIRRYGFTHSCYVGRPDPGFSYLRK